ncbi:MAG: hypothetical protein ACAH17_00745 [Candidatus Paceibacterota bacterium]
MPRKKEYKSNSNLNASELEINEESNASSFSLPRNLRNIRNVDLSEWLGQGIDDWVWESVKVCEERLHSKQYSVRTVLSMAYNGLRIYLRYLVENESGSVPSRPSALKACDVIHFINWLKKKYPNGCSSKNIYQPFKSLILGLIDHGYISKSREELFPNNPFPLIKKTIQSEKPLSQAEMQRLATALKRDLIAIHHKTFDGLDSEAIVVLMLLISMRSGLNTSPLFELSRDCLVPHPFMPNLMILESFKRRGRGAQTNILKNSQTQDISVSIPLDGVAVIKLALELTQPLAAIAPAEIQNRLWLFQSSAYGEKGKPLWIQPSSAYQIIRMIVKRHGILSDDGSKLRVTFGRLRKTMEQRLWKLSDGDIQAVASAMGHSTQVADNHYLQLDDSLKAASAQFIGEALPAKLRGLHLVATPTGNCKDSLHGANAPKNGLTHCEDFTHCLSCPSYAIVGTVEDLHRLFSFQRFLIFEMEYFTKAEWKDWQSHYQILISKIDQIADENFDFSLLSKARALAQNAPHKFWDMRMRQSNLIRGARNG